MLNAPNDNGNGYVKQPYMMVLAFDEQSSGVGVSADASTACRNNTNRPFVITHIGFSCKQATGVNSSRTNFAVNLFKTTESSSLTSQFVDINSVTSYDTPLMELPVPYVLGINEALTGSNKVNIFGATVAGNAAITADTLHVTFLGVLQ